VRARYGEIGASQAVLIGARCAFHVSCQEATIGNSSALASGAIGGGCAP
jgi:hypothetical protein